MRHALVLGFIAAALALPAMANDVEDQCVAYTAENDGDPSGCACLGDAASKDPALADAIAMIETPEDLETAPDSVKAAVGACWPEA